MSTTTLQFVLSLLEKQGPVPGENEDEQRAYPYLLAGHLDSFAVMSFITEIEGHYGMTLDPEDTQSYEFRTVGGLADLLDRKLQTQTARENDC